ncbi:auxin-responsive protein IAA8-like isoform X1 [Hibiscus syriacus]|uniref:Auxin-responsive protein IAA8-like isoform X1 n=1 Tax=Hibiscus syriacus TaxID=106335 RepID=A0A6A2YN69_HIBSY|nr:protein THYLAKOID ASSEMBLY 8, chloroplastic-like [Hibiscus syriacus]KAE8680767.1 auxin-responsive protein IAA8-like isoform X1 [Hibiscus syriacus]
MASSLRFNPTSIPSLHPLPAHKSFTPIRCGPRDNRGPLVKGRILSTEAIQAIQALKRAHRNSSSTATTLTPLPSLSRLIKSDLIAALRELLRQDQCTLALHVLSTIRSEYPPPDLALYADVVAALARNRLMEEIDGLVEELGSIECDDEKALVRLIKGVIGAGRKVSTVRICGLMKENGIGSRRKVGEYVVKVLSKGLRRFGEVDLALEVEREFSELSRANLDKSRI